MNALVFFITAVLTKRARIEHVFLTFELLHFLSHMVVCSTRSLLIKIESSNAPFSKVLSARSSFMHVSAEGYNAQFKVALLPVDDCIPLLEWTSEFVHQSIE
jgi:hypothetical protein